MVTKGIKMSIEETIAYIKAETDIDVNYNFDYDCFFIVSNDIFIGDLETPIEELVHAAWHDSKIC